MPYIEVNLSQELTTDQETALKTGFGEIISEIPGKSEGSLMMCFRDQSRMWFAGKNDKPVVFVQVMLYGSADKQSFQHFSDKAMALLAQVTDAGPSGIYIKFEETLNFFWA